MASRRPMDDRASRMPTDDTASRRPMEAQKTRIGITKDEGKYYTVKWCFLGLECFDILLCITHRSK